MLERGHKDRGLLGGVLPKDLSQELTSGLRQEGATVRRGQPEQRLQKAASVPCSHLSSTQMSWRGTTAGEVGLGSALLPLQSGGHGHDLNTGEQREAQKGFMQVSNGVRVVLLKGGCWKKVGRGCGVRRTDQRGDSIGQEMREAA